MTRRELQQSLKTFREQGLTTIKLTAKTIELQAEFDRVSSCPAAKSPIPSPTVTEELETVETIHPEAVQIIEPVKETFISCSSASLDRAGAWDETKVWQIIPKHRVFEPINNGDVQIRTFTQFKPRQIEQEFNSLSLENFEYARINGHGPYPPPQAIEHHYFTNMDTQSLFELETIEQRLNDLIAEAPDIVIKGRLNTALLQISSTLDEAFKDA